MTIRRLVAGATVLLIALALWLRLGPIDASLLRHQESVTVLDRHGVILYEPLGTTGTRTDRLVTIPPHVEAATLAAEDHRFHKHPGIDPIAVARAFAHNVRAMRVVEGGSTITQQVAKLLLARANAPHPPSAPSPQKRGEGSRDKTSNRDPSPPAFSGEKVPKADEGASPRSLSHKLREATLALRLEHRFTKREILAMYLNLAPYGNRITGIARASRAYFGCEPESLTPAQAAYLAALPQRPSAFNPLRNPGRARKRQLAVLARMNLAPVALKHARSERLQFRSGVQPSLAMHFVEKVLASTDAQRITTTLDAGLQREVQGIIATRRDELLRHGARSVAVAVLDNRTGGWLAWEGSGDYFGTTFGGAIDGVTTPRQPGSALKPFTYALAFENGETPATVLADVPSSFPTAEDGIVYTPRNYDGEYRGPLRVRTALATSQNVPAVAMLAKLGPASLLRFLRHAGFSNLDHTADYYGLGLTLGDAEVTLEQLVVAYAAFARGGAGVEQSRRVVSPTTAFWITDILSDSDARAYAFGTGGSLDFPFPVAVKTGTSQAYRDNWTIGYTRDVTVGVWVGNFDRRELHGSSGVTGAAPIFNSVMLAAVKRVRGSLPIGDTTPIVAPPDDLARIAVCTLSGLRPSTHCPTVENEWLAKSAPAQFCSWHHAGVIDWPTEYRGWSGAIAASATKPGGRSGRRSTTALRIANPPDGATYLIDPTLRMEYQTLRLRAVASTKVAWKIGERSVGTSSPDAAFDWPLSPGAHTITATDAEGREDSVKIFVK